MDGAGRVALVGVSQVGLLLGLGGNLQALSTKRPVDSIPSYRVEFGVLVAQEAGRRRLAPLTPQPFFKPLPRVGADLASNKGKARGPDEWQCSLGIVIFAVTYIGYWAVLITGRYPPGLFDLVVGVQRWSYRTNAWMYGWTDRYPSFGLS